MSDPFQLQLGSPPHLVAIAGPNGAGKSTFYQSQLSHSGLRWVNADVIAAQLNLDPYAAASVADRIRRLLVRQRESFVFETVFSDPIGDKVQFLFDTAADGYDVTLCYIGLSSAEQSIERVSMRVSQGGHDVPIDKLKSRYLRTLENLGRAIQRLPRVLVFDQSDLRYPFRFLAHLESGKLIDSTEELANWLRNALPET
ncbi:Zeta toxin [Bremerella volcania]|uniref:Zeta toxin n=1 Tax=Bremerella volcania TaxID=2527984 RepID=A0A518CAI8_9BACT|nr:zeta toxin family protein [Bremerella volcania]QDU76246.1 Zeta toxin [Bremerella volcania]